MANANGSIDEIIGQEAIKQIDDATAKMGTLLTTFKESVTAVNLMNDALNKAGSGGSGGLKSNTTAINEQEKALKALIKANEDAGKEYIQLQQLTKQQTAANRLDAQSANASKGSYNELQANMSLLIAKYKALSAEMRSGAIGKGLQADIAMANKSLKDLDAGLGNMQRNVGNYGSALSKIWGGIRQIAYILPGLGIAGIFNLAGDAILYAADKMGVFSTNTEEVKTAVDELSESFDRLNKTTEFNITYADRDLKLALANAKKRGASIKELAEIENKYAKEKVAAISIQISKENELIAGYYRQKQILERQGVDTKDVLKAIKDGEEKVNQLMEKRSDLNIDIQVRTIDAQTAQNKKDSKPVKEVNRIDDLKKQMNDDIAVAKVAASEAYKTENELRQDILEIYKKYATEKLKAVENLNKDEEHSSKQLGEQILKDTQSIVEKQTAEINKQIKNDIDQHNKALKVKIKNNDERVKDEEKACDDIDKRNNETFDKQKNDAEKLKKQREDNQKALMDSLQSMQNSTFDIINTISDAINEREMQRLDAKDKALAESYKNELRWIEQSGMSEANKAKAISKLDAQNEAQKKQNDRDRITALRKHARLQKAIDVNQAIANTAVAIVGMLGNPGGYPGVVMSIAAAVTGAAQIARIIATPLPQYAKGRKGGKAEHAIVGEIGQEAIVTTDGKVTLTPSTPSLAYIPQGADVIPHNELIKNSAYVALAKQGTVTTDKLQMALIDEFERNTNEIKELKEIMKSKNLTATYNGLGGFESYKQANIR